MPFGRRSLWAVLVACLPLFESATALGDAPGKVEEVEIVVREDESHQKYLLVYPPEFKADKPTPLLIVLHGHGSDRKQVMDDRVHEFQAARDVAAARGMLICSPDYRARTSWMGPKAEADMLRILGDLKGQFKIDKVIISGASMGGSAALTFAVLHPDLVDGVVSMNGTANHLEYENFQDAIRESFGGSKAEKFLEYKQRSAEYWPEKLTMPLAITASGKDTSVPPGSVLRLAEVVKKHNPKVLVTYRPEAGHSTSYEDSKAAYEFVADAVLPQAKTPESAK